jgi:uncharacterized protein YjbI with pentapeptide repeats
MPDDARSADHFTIAETLALNRIEAIGRNARAVWLGLLGYLAFAGLTLFTVQDVDFFSAASETTLPIVNVAIPTTNFFWAAAWLGVLLHAYLHLYLEKLWDTLAEAPAELAGKPLGDRISPWLVNDWALRRRPDRPITKRPLGLFGDLFTTLIVWLATPLLIGAIWWRSMPAHLPWLTLIIAAALLLALYVSLSGWRRAKTVLRRNSTMEVTAQEQENALLQSSRWKDTKFTDFALPSVSMAIILLSIARTEGTIAGLEIQAIPLAPINLVGAELIVKPEGWASREIAQSRFRAEWCRDRALPAEVCEQPTTAYHTAARKRWCEERQINDCLASFKAINEAFMTEWSEERREYLSGLLKSDLRGRDLRGANLRGAFLAGADLQYAQLDRANLENALLEGANLGEASLISAELYGARLNHADLGKAKLESANLREASLMSVNLSTAYLAYANLQSITMENSDLFKANLQNADMRFANLRNSNLTEVKLQDAVLIGANLGGTMLLGASLEGADLRAAKFLGARFNAGTSGAAGRSGGILPIFSETSLEGADLSFADLSGSDLLGNFKAINWDRTTIGPSIVIGANFLGGRALTQTQLAQVVGRDGISLPFDAATGRQLHVWACWDEEAAATYVELQTEHQDWRTVDETWEDIREHAWVCAPGMDPLPVLGKR